MDVLVVVPRRGGNEWRDRLWRYVNARWAGWPVREGHHDHGPFNRSAAINQAAQGSWSVAVIADADTLIDFDRLREGIELARSSGKLVLPHDHFRSLTRPATRAILAGELEPAAAPARWEVQNTKSSCLCIGRELWDEVGGFDEAFVGWGAEDSAFYVACGALAGVERLEGPVEHLWHPRSAEKDPSRPEYQANFDRLARYKAVRYDAAAMGELLFELQAAA